MPNHIQRVYTFRITADEVNQIMGCRPNKLTDSDIEFINDKIAEQMDALRNNVIGVIVQAKNAYKKRKDEYEKSRAIMKRQTEIHLNRMSWLGQNPQKKCVRECAECNKFVTCYEDYKELHPHSAEEHIEKYGHEATGFMALSSYIEPEGSEIISSD